MGYDDWRTNEPDPFVYDFPPDDEAPCWFCGAREDEDCTPECFCHLCMRSKPMVADPRARQSKR